jgi:hypothetical protein
MGKLDCILFYEQERCMQKLQVYDSLQQHRITSYIRESWHFTHMWETFS